MIDVNLDDAKVQEIAKSSYDLVVIDYIASDKENVDYPIKPVVETLRTAAHPKLVLAYADVGQAESYRTYWQSDWTVGNPDWILRGDPDGWEENYVVAFWEEAWQQIWLGDGGLVGSIADAGFDGIYLDWIEAYSDDAVTQAAAGRGIDPANSMAGFVRKIGQRARTRNEGFVVIGQNAAELAAHNGEYRASIDGLAQEQIWFDGGADGDPPGDCPLPKAKGDVESSSYYSSLSPACQALHDDQPNSTLHMSSEEYLSEIDKVHAQGIPIFTVDYATDETNISFVMTESRRRGFKPFASTRNLDRYVRPR